MKFNVQLGNLVLRSCNVNLTGDGVHTTAEIVALLDNENTTVCIAYWLKGNIVFVESRFKPLNHTDLFKLMDIGQQLLNSGE